jgi:hypothetical protein
MVQWLAQPSSFNTTDVYDRYTMMLTNMSTGGSSGTVTVTVKLPKGVTMSELPQRAGEEPVTTEWNCKFDEKEPGEKEHREATCTTTNSVPALTSANPLFVPVTVQAVAGEHLTSEVRVSGGVEGCVEGGEPPCPRTSTNTTMIVGAPVPAFAPLGFTAAALDPSGAPDTQAGDHPGGLATAFAFPSADASYPPEGVHPRPVEDVKQIVINLPAGIVGNPQAAPACSLAELSNFGRCSPTTQVGTLTALEPGSVQTPLPVFNVVPEQGYPAEFGVFDPKLERAVLLYASVRPYPDYGVTVASAPQDRVVQIGGVTSAFFGNPATEDHSGNTPTAFFTSPSDCSAPSFTTTIHVDSWQHPAKFNPDGTPDLTDPNWKSASSQSPPVTNCEALQFQPELDIKPETTLVDTPSRYEIDLKIPQNEDPTGLATPPLKNAVVTLPPGVSVSPSAADGLDGCNNTPGMEPEPGNDQIGLSSAKPGSCSPRSQIGDVEVITPLLNEQLKGHVYVAQPACGGSGQPACTEEAAERGGVFALYLEVGSEQSGIHIKLPGTVEVGGNGPHSRETGLAPGQVRTTFANTPQQPFSELKLRLNGGPRAPLANPQADSPSCGPEGAKTVSELVPWSSPQTSSASPSPSFALSGCGSPLPFSPSFSAGTTNPQAGAYSPFTLTFSRRDGEQNLAGLTVNMPQGLLGKIAGIAQCGEGEANAGTCSAASRVGSATAAAGSGSHPFWQSGNVYLTGPYKDAPFGLSVVVPAKAGPFNLGNIVVRAAIHIDPHTAQVTVVSDPLPQMVDGVPLRVQTVNVTIDREGFTFNPTSCEPMRVSGTLTGTGGASVPVASRFQAANCASLPFKPTFTVSTQGKTSKANGASLVVRVAQKPGEANIHKVDLQLPLILPARLTTLQKACTEAQFAANPAGCPSASVIGTATAVTPVLSVPLTGPAYLVSHGGAAFPDVEFVLQGQGVTVVLDGGTDIKKGITYSRFETVPDAPISSFETVLPEGPHSALTANEDLCAQTRVVTVRRRVLRRVHGRTRHVTRSVRQVVPPSLSMPTTITGQNGAQIRQTTKIAVMGCARHKRAKKAARHKTRRKRK